MMSYLHTAAGATYVTQLLVSAFLAILFLQSGIDKVVDRAGNLSWLTGHFAKSPLAKMVPVLLMLITVLELVAGTLSAVGCLLILIGRGSAIAYYGAVVSAVSLVALFFGQRMAKEYAGAGALVPYFLLTLVGLYALATR